MVILCGRVKLSEVSRRCFQIEVEERKETIRSTDSSWLIDFNL